MFAPRYFPPRYFADRYFARGATGGGGPTYADMAAFGQGQASAPLLSLVAVAREQPKRKRAGYVSFEEWKNKGVGALFEARGVAPATVAALGVDDAPAGPIADLVADLVAGVPVPAVPIFGMSARDLAAWDEAARIAAEDEDDAEVLLLLA